jgi:hypothetical protein
MNHGRGGGLSCSYESETFLTDSILWGNTGTLGNQIAIGSDDEPVYIDRPATLHVSHCDIQGGNSPQSIFYEPGRILNWIGGNIDTDPLFVMPYYYLSQTAAGQASDSPCVDAGSDLATVLGLGNYTTRTDGANDVNEVDMGLHYPAADGQYQLTVNVVGTHGTITPNSGFFNKFTPVTLTATVDPGYRVKWIGTDDDTVYSLTNTVMMYSDRTVTAIIEEHATLYVPTPEYPTVQDAIEAAEDGDTIILNRGTYVGAPDPTYSGRIVIIDKAITITSVNPDDPATVADTIIDCNGYSTYGIVLSGVGPDTVINGLTIANTTWGRVAQLSPPDPGDDGYPGWWNGAAGIYIYPGASPTILNCIIRDCQMTAGDASSGNGGDTGAPGGSGGDGGDAYGGGIYCSYRSSPTIRNCTISNVRIIGGDAGNGGNGGDNSGDDSVAGNGGNGGNGGVAYGGGIFVDFDSTPVITDCTIINCSATGGDGGDAGNGGNTSGTGSLGGDGGNGGYNGRAYGGGIHFANNIIAAVSNCRIINCSATAGDAGNGGNYGDGDSPGFAGYGGGYLPGYTIYSARGGGVYSGNGSIITFEECAFSNNTITGGMSGIGGDAWAGQRPPINSYLIPVYGAGVFCDSDTRTTFEGCHIAENSADDVYDPIDPNQLVYRLNPYVSYGGGIYYIDVNSATITDSNFSNNYATIGGGLYWDEADDFMLTNSNITGNSAFKGGGIYGGGIYGIDSGPTTITGCIITGNQAVYPGGEGGGVYLSTLPALITDSEIRYNYADYSGGGLYLSGDVSVSETKILKNCLITNNLAGRDGGGISASWHNELTISNCTIHNNIAYDVNIPNGGYGGGLFCGYGSYTDIIDSILWNNFGNKGSEISVGTASEPSTVAVSYSDIDGWQTFEPNVINPAAVFVDTGCVLNWDFSSVIDAYPFFVNGYFLSQTAAGQFINSPCVDNGSGDANDPNIGMYPNKYTTRTDYVGDANTVDMGYHLPMIIHLTASVVDANGTVITDPNLALGYVVPTDMFYPRGTVAQITAYPDPNYQVARWTGTDNDASMAPTNTVTMDSDKHVTVEFEVATFYQLTTTVIGGHGTLTVQPPGGIYTNYTVVTLIATPDPGYRVKTWTGTDDDLSYALTNTQSSLSWMLLTNCKSHSNMLQLRKL